MVPAKPKESSEVLNLKKIEEHLAKQKKYINNTLIFIVMLKHTRSSFREFRLKRKKWTSITTKEIKKLKINSSNSNKDIKMNLTLFSRG